MRSRHSHPCTVLAFQKVRSEKMPDYLSAQGRISSAMEQFPGFLGKEVVKPVPGLQEEWVSVFRFATAESLRAWMESEDRRAMIRELDSLSTGESRIQVIAGDDEEDMPVTVLFTHHVKSGYEAAYREWRREVLRAMAVWPGYLGADIFDARGAFQKDFVLVVRFDSAKSLETWMASKKRAEYLARLNEIVESYTAYPLGSGMGGWFAFDDAPNVNEPPRWKQIFMVTMGLYPIVMLLALYVDPRLEWIPFPIHMLIGNIICVSLLTWPVMPWLNRRFRRWLLPSGAGARNSLGGAVIIAAMMLGWVVLFLSLWK